jgi:hypothetical protein
MHKMTCFDGFTSMQGESSMTIRIIRVTSVALIAIGVISSVPARAADRLESTGLEAALTLVNTVNALEKATRPRKRPSVSMTLRETG